MGLVHIFGEKPIPKVLDFFRVHQAWDYSIKDVSKATGISFRTIQSIMPQLIRKGIVIKTRKEGNANMYIFNRDSHVAKELNNFAREIDFQSVERPKTPVPETMFGVDKGKINFRQKEHNEFTRSFHA